MRATVLQCQSILEREGQSSKAPPALNNYEDGSNWQVPGHRWLHRDRSPIFNYNHLIQSALEMLMLLLLLPYITEDCAHSLLVPSFFVSVRYTMLSLDTQHTWPGTRDTLGIYARQWQSSLCLCLYLAGAYYHSTAAVR